MSLGVALSNAVSGLKLNQEALSVLSQNLANVNTEGYTRKTISQSAVYIEGAGNGVKIDDIIRKVDTYLQKSVLTQGAITQQATTVNDYYDRIQTLLGKPGGTDSIDEDLTTFFNTMQQMADQPDRTSYRSNMVSSANLLAQHVSGLASDLESLRFQADSDLSGAVTEVNSALKKLYELNAAIGHASASGQSTSGLLDDRDRALKKLSENLSITVAYDPTGTVTVTTANGNSLVDGQLHQLNYSAVNSLDNLVDNVRMSAITISTYDISGVQVGTPAELVSSGTPDTIKSGLGIGKMQALLDVRDQLVPAILDQLDMLAGSLRDTMNALHNDGSGYPPAASLSGTRQISATDIYEWSGSVRIGVLKSDGTPVPSGYVDEAYTGIRPLTLDLSSLNMGQGNGVADINTIVKEINNHFGAPPVKTELGALNSIRLVADTDYLPTGLTSKFDFDLDLENLTGGDASIFVTGMTVKDSTGADITNVSQSAPSIALSPAGTYTTVNGSSSVDIKLTSTAGLVAGDKIYLGAPGVASVNGIQASELTGYFTIKSINNGVITIDSNGTANADGAVSDNSGVAAFPKYDTIAPGEQTRTTSSGKLQVDLSGNITAKYYDITLNVGVIGTDGVVKQSQITYRIPNAKSDMLNQRYDSTASNGEAVRVLPNTTQSSLRAIIVDAKGNELPKLNGEYLDGPGYLKIVSDNPAYTVSIDEMDSAQLGNGSTSPIIPGTGWGFSHFFGLNDFFDPNEPTANGETLKNSAINLKVQQRLIDNPNLVTSSTMVQQKQPVAGSGDKPQYTYLRYAGDNATAQAIAGLNAKTLTFEAAGGLPRTNLSLTSYTSEMLGYVASLSAAAQTNADSAETLYDGFNSRAQAASGVNLDEELANTVIFQNSYSATARIVSVVDEMFKTLIDTV